MFSKSFSSLVVRTVHFCSPQLDNVAAEPTSEAVKNIAVRMSVAVSLDEVDAIAIGAGTVSAKRTDNAFFVAVTGIEVEKVFLSEEADLFIVHTTISFW